ncbi:MAG: hypothetical protein IPM80_09890 [Proteobacteria bacterium]|nr:hypothetical protein [Pseudomonadota bacterium]
MPVAVLRKLLLPPNVLLIDVDTVVSSSHNPRFSITAPPPSRNCPALPELFVHVVVPVVSKRRPPVRSCRPAPVTASAPSKRVVPVPVIVAVPKPGVLKVDAPVTVSVPVPPNEPPLWLKLVTVGDSAPRSSEPPEISKMSPRLTRLAAARLCVPFVTAVVPEMS